MDKMNLNNGYFWDDDKQKLIKDDLSIYLTKSEKRFVECLVKNLNHVVSYEDIHNYIYSLEHFSLGALSTLAKKIRKKTQKDFITNTSKKGYSIQK
jgi:DNA-binding winged helix-turn-helix (wHTH) protein